MLYKKIIECNLEFHVPLSKNCIDLIRRLLNPNPLKRITINDVKHHNFYLQGLSLLNLMKIEHNDMEINDLVMTKLAELGYSSSVVDENLKKSLFNQITTCYYLTLNKIKYEKYLVIIKNRLNKVHEINNNETVNKRHDTEAFETKNTQTLDEIETLLHK